MLSSVLKSKKEILVNIAIMKEFVQMRKFLQGSESLARELRILEKETKEKFEEHEKHINDIFKVIKQLIIEKQNPKKPIGFITPKNKN